MQHVLLLSWQCAHTSPEGHQYPCTPLPLIAHSTLGPQPRPSAPIWPALAPMSDRASRDLGRRTRRAMHTPSDAHPRVRIPNTRGRSTYLDAQRAQQPRYNRLLCAHMHGTAHASDAKSNFCRFLRPQNPERSTPRFLINYFACEALGASRRKHGSPAPSTPLCVRSGRHSDRCTSRQLARLGSSGSSLSCAAVWPHHLWSSLALC